MNIKKCAVCRTEVKRGTGQYRNGRLIHRKCLVRAKLQPWVLNQ